MRGLRPSLCAAGSLLAAAGALWLLASALLGFHAWPGGPAEDAPGVARLPAVTTPAKLAARRTATPARRVAPARRTRAAVPSPRRRGTPRIAASPSVRGDAYAILDRMRFDPGYMPWWPFAG